MGIKTSFWSPELKTELGRINTEFSKFPDSEQEKGLMKFAPAPIGFQEHLLIRLWDKHLPRWRHKEEKAVPLTPESERLLVEHIQRFTDAPTTNPPESFNGEEMDQLAIQRKVPKRKGNWWLLPKDLKVKE